MGVSYPLSEWQPMNMGFTSCVLFVLSTSTVMVAAADPKRKVKKTNILKLVS